jgi:hypothetical protein
LAGLDFDCKDFSFQVFDVDSHSELFIDESLKLPLKSFALIIKPINTGSKCYPKNPGLNIFYPPFTEAYLLIFYTFDKNEAENPFETNTFDSLY